MSLQVITLRKLLKLMFLEPSELTTALRADIREERDREKGWVSGGGDFYGPFWRDAKEHVFGHADLGDLTKDRVEANDNRKGLYPILKDGFLLWWNDRRRWTNAPFEAIDTPKARFKIANLDLTIKVDAVLAVQDGAGEDHYVYPYWFPKPALTPESARLALWILTQAFPHINSAEFRVLDVMRGLTFALDRTPLKGDEADTFSRHYARLVLLRQQLRDQYDH